MKEKKKPIHLSLFPNENCEVCGKPVINRALHCSGCHDKWLELKEKIKKD